jgi:ABC-type uncharacterized transport system permease subunit
MDIGSACSSWNLYLYILHIMFVTINFFFLCFDWNLFNFNGKNSSGSNFSTTFIREIGADVSRLLIINDPNMPPKFPRRLA